MNGWYDYLRYTNDNSQEKSEEREKLLEELLKNFFIIKDDVFDREAFADYMLKCKDLISPFENCVIDKETYSKYCKSKKPKAKPITEAFIKKLSGALTKTNNTRLRLFPFKCLNLTKSKRLQCFALESAHVENLGALYRFSYEIHSTGLHIYCNLKISRNKASLSVERNRSDNFPGKVTIDFETIKQLFPKMKFNSLKQQIEIASKHGIDISEIPEELCPPRETVKDNSADTIDSDLDR